jgi:hypothetical protein
MTCLVLAGRGKRILLKQAASGGREIARERRKKVYMNTYYAGAVAVLLMVGSSGSAADTEVRVDCSKGQSINGALRHKADDLIVVISGLCEENVVVNRERVTLRGADPAADGIRAATLDTPGSFALLVRSSYVRVENLRITGGQTYGLVVSHTSGYGRFGWGIDRAVEVINCRIMDNPGIGLLAEYSSVRVIDTNFSGNATGGAYASEAGLSCINCTFTNNGTALAGFVEATVTSNRGIVSLTNSNVTGVIGLNVLHGRAIVTDSSIATTDVRAVSGFFESEIFLSGSSVIGRIALGQQSHARIEGVTQTANTLGSSGIGLDQGASFVASNRDAAATTLVGDITLRGFSSAVLRDDSSLNGNLTCIEGSNVACTDPSKVAGTSSCGLCPK